MGAATHGSAAAVAPYFNGVFPLEAPGSVSGWTTTNAFPNLTFIDPIWLCQVPGTNDLVVVSKVGRIWRFPNDPAVMSDQMTLALDLQSLVQPSEDQGMYRIAFHPQFGQAGSPHAADVFVSYNYRPAVAEAAPDKSMWRLSRFQWQAGTGTIDPASEAVLIQQFDPHRWHNGGAIEFDNEGYLLVTCGDGGGANDEFDRTQKINEGFFGGVLRIDPDNNPARSHAIRRQPLDGTGKPSSFPASFTQGYGIPNDNPWLDAAGTRLEEFYAIGLRSPHSAKFDPPTGELWVGDVGQAGAEEVSRIFKGANCQWPFREATLTGPKPKPSAANLIGAETVPIYSYERSLGSCVIGGFRYRGAKWASEFEGDLIFGDNGKGSLSAGTLRPDQSLYQRPVVTGFGSGIYGGLSAIATDAAGEIYMLKLNGVGQPGGVVRRLVQTGSQAEPPALLSATGLFADMASLQPASALIPYEVASPLWSDGASKKRWMILPNDGSHNTASERIAYSEDGNWKFPAGTVFVKHFETATSEQNPAAVRRLETRVMVCTADGGKYGLTYKWNAAGTDATLLSEGEEIAYGYTTASGATETRQWSIPSRADCLQCHGEASGQSLGLRAHQINRLVANPAGGALQNQLSLFVGAGYLTPPPSAAAISSMLRGAPPDDTSAPLELRVKSYLDSNCAHCHQPGASAPFFDARLVTPLRGQNLVNGLIAGQFNLGPDGRYIKPGDALLSAIHVRAASNVPGIAMPPLAKHRVDQAASAMIGSYIAGLTEGEFAGGPTLTARYVRLSATSTGTRAIAELKVLDGRGMPIPPSHIALAGTSSSADGNPGTSAIDGNPATYWQNFSSAIAHLTLDLGNVREVGGFIYTPRQDLPTGRFTGYQLLLSQNGSDWAVADSGTWVTTSAVSWRSDDLNRPRPVRCEITGPATPVNGAFKVTIVFDTAVSDFTASDIQVVGGGVTELVGRGYYYIATVLPHESSVTVSVPGNVVSTVHAGNRSSNPWSVENTGETSPVGQLVSVPDLVEGPFLVGLDLDRPIQGIPWDDIIVTGGMLMSRDESSPLHYILLIEPDGTGNVTVKIRDNSVTGVNGLPMRPLEPVTIAYGSALLKVEAEAGVVSGGFVAEEDPSASCGGYLWVPEGARAGNSALDTQLKVSYQVRVPHSGHYRLQALTRSDDAASDSFYVGIDGEAAPARWLTNQTAGQTGSGLFHADLANFDGNPRVFTLAAGNHLLELYAGDDGTRIDRLELVSVRPAATWVGDGKWADLPYEATLRFSEPVSGLEIGDFEIAHGQLESISGVGSEYHLLFQYTGAELGIALKEGAVQNASGQANHLSPTLVLSWVNTYEQWALNHGVDPSVAGRDADADHDGVAQILEYAFRLDPARADAHHFDPLNPQLGGLPKFTVLDGEGALRGLELEFLMRRLGQPLDYLPEFGSDLSHFDPGVIYSFEGLDEQWARVRAYDPFATGQERRRFGRLKVEVRP